MAEAWAKARGQVHQSPPTRPKMADAVQAAVALHDGEFVELCPHAPRKALLLNVLSVADTMKPAKLKDIVSNLTDWRPRHGN